jgi:hypothetical protein
MKTFTFNVDNDRGFKVAKTETLDWVKAKIRCDLQEQGYKTTFLVRQISDNAVEIYDTKGNTAKYHYGGFDECEVMEPFSHKNWPLAPKAKKAKKLVWHKNNKTPQKTTPYVPGSIRNKVLSKGDVEQNIKNWPFPLSEKDKEQIRLSVA